MPDRLPPRVRTAPRATAPYPTTPVRQFSFTNFSTNNPTTPQPGNNIDSEYDRSNASISQIINWLGVSLNTDGTLRTASVGAQQIAPGVFDFIAADAINQVQPLVDDAQSFASSAGTSSTTAQAAATAAAASNTQAQGAATAAATSATTATTQAQAANSSALAAQNAASNAANAANDADGDLALCTDYGLVTQAWAEHMPDIIPPNILAVMGITGSHWSSRWWASQAAATVALLYGALNYRGAWNPVTNTPVLASGGLSGGVPSKAGDYYVASVTGTSVVIDGSTTWSAGDLIVSNGTVWQRIQSSGGAFLPLVGGVMLGPITLSGNAAQPMQAVPLQQVLPLVGGTMTGPITLSGNATTPLQAVPLQQVNSVSAGGPFLPTGGGGMLGPLTLSGNATTALQAVPLQQVNAAVGVINVKAPPYNAVGDGTTNDAPAFQAALTAAAAGGKVVVPAGTYNVGSALSCSVTGVVALEGAGSGVTILNFSNATDGITFNLTTTATVHVRGMTIARTSTSAGAYANTGLTISTAAPQVARIGNPTIVDVLFMGNAARSTAWATGINVFNTSLIGFDAVFILMPDANGTNVGVGVSLVGLSNTSMLVDTTFNNFFTQGGGIGLHIGVYLQGVYFGNSRCIGCDYGIKWDGVFGEGTLCLLVSNCHFNASTRCVYCFAAASPQIVNTYNLHFAVPSVTGDWAAFELHNLGTALISNNNIFGNGSSFAGVENAIQLSGSNQSQIIGNHMAGIKNDAIVLTATQSTLIVGNIGQGIGGQLIAGETISNFNQQIANQYNSVMDISLDNSNALRLNATGISYNNGNAVAFAYAGGGKVTVQVDGNPEGTILTDSFVAANQVTFSNVGFHNTSPPAKPTVTGAKGSNAALASLMVALAAYGLVTDSTSA